MATPISARSPCAKAWSSTARREALKTASAKGICFGSTARMARVSVSKLGISAINPTLGATGCRTVMGLPS